MSLDTLFAAQNAFFVFKIGLLVLLVLFFLFQLVLLNQNVAMNKIITQPKLFPILQSIIFGLLIATIVLFLATLVIL